MVNAITAKCDTVKCPTCGETGQKVANETVRHILKSKNKKSVGEEEFYLCMNPECDAAYFSSKLVFSKSALKKPLWYKTDANPKYACYCRKITQEELTHAVLQTGLTEAGEIMLHLRGNVKSNCRINNPTGHCCHPVFNEMIEEALRTKSEKKLCRNQS